MPIVNNRYVAPTWTNGSGQAIDASELNALSQTVQGCQAPTNHASASTSYGKATNSQFGHVKLTDRTDSPNDASTGWAASPAAVAAVMTAVNGRKRANETVTYFGSGGWGENSQTSFTLPDEQIPTMVLIRSTGFANYTPPTPEIDRNSDSVLVLFPNAGIGLSLVKGGDQYFSSSPSMYYLRASVSGTTLRWYHTGVLSPDTEFEPDVGTGAVIQGNYNEILGGGTESETDGARIYVATLIY